MPKNFISNYEYPVVSTPKGLIRGYFYDGVFNFKGIKYANAKRFHKPEPVEPWEGIKNALSWGFNCPTMTEDSRDETAYLDHRYWPKNENCQYLNVWTTTIDSTAKKPVILWIHGGGFAGCSAIELLCADGEEMCGYGDVVMVSLNHRLNILGFLDVSAYGPQYDNSGNAGLADLVIALEWIRDNIAAFGGDPDNVTIMGQSGGGGKVCALLQCPAADGLFHKAIVHSGIHARRQRPTPEVSKVLVGEMLDILGISPDEIEKLEEVEYHDLVKAYNTAVPRLRAQGLQPDGWAPLANGYYQGYARLDGFYEHALKVPTMIGTCFSEFEKHPMQPFKYQLSEDKIVSLIRERYHENADRMIDLFRKAYPEKNLLDLLVLDAEVRYGSLDHILKRSAFEGSAPVYSYVFAQEFRNYDNGLTAFHCAELPYAFHTTSRVMVCQQDGVEKLEDEMAGAWAAFAHTGDPNHEGLAEWPAFTKDNHATMVFCEDSRARIDFDTELINTKNACDPSFEEKMAMLFRVSEKK
jgi:para-nitrobenzyl esterase